MEKILKRADGTRYKISMDIITNVYGSDKRRMMLTVERCLPGKKKFKSIHYDSYEYRRLSMEEKQAFVLEEQLQHVTKDEVNQVLWELIVEIYNDCKLL